MYLIKHTAESQSPLPHFIARLILFYRCVITVTHLIARSCLFYRRVFTVARLHLLILYHIYNRIATVIFELSVNSCYRQCLFFRSVCRCIYYIVYIVDNYIFGFIDFAREGDTIYVHDFSRLARSTSDLLNIVEQLNTPAHDQ